MDTHGSPSQPQSDDPSGNSASARTAGERADADGLRILFVEDDDGDARLVSDDLAERLAGVQIIRCTSLRDALAHAEEHVDCVVLDLGLPDASGLEAVTKLGERLAPAPLVVLTGLDDEATGISAVRAGAQDYLVKGHLDHGELARAVRYAIGRRQIASAEWDRLVAQLQAREAERIERGLAPRPVVQDPSVWIESCYRPGRSRALLGGDFLDALAQGDGFVQAVVGDVCGHGPDEAAVGVSMRAAWRALAVSGVDLEPMLGALEELFLEEQSNAPGLFTTLCTLRISLAERLATVLVAGHPRPLLIAGTSVRPLGDGRGGRALGIGAGEWLPETVPLPDDWAILLYTDGVIDGRVGEGSQRLSDQGLCDLISELAGAEPDWKARPKELLNGALERAESLNGDALNDDVAMLLVGPVGAQAQG
jgi:serine phosphatase RsbU (regulator of sigma subunit)